MESKVIRLNEDEIEMVKHAIINSIVVAKKGLEAEKNISDCDSDKFIELYNFQIKILNKIIDKLY